MATQVDMPILEAVTATQVDKHSLVRVPILGADMSIPTAVAAITVDPLIRVHGSIPEAAVVTMGVAATITVEKDTMAGMATTVAGVTMGDVDIMAADMATSAGEVFIWGSTVHPTTIMAPTTTVQVTTVLQATTTSGATGIQVPVIPIDQQYLRPTLSLF